MHTYSLMQHFRRILCGIGGYFRALSAGLLLIVCGGLPLYAQTRSGQNPPPIPYPKDLLDLTLTVRGSDAPDKLAPELRILRDQLRARGRGETDETERFSAEQLAALFGINGSESDPVIGVAISVKQPLDVKTLAAQGVKVYLYRNGILFADAPVSVLDSVAEMNAVTAIKALNAVRTPPLPDTATKPEFISLERGRGGAPAPLPSAARGAANQPVAKLDRLGFTGKGVIVGVVDSGIDWRHPDFIRADGTSRLLAILDFTDDSFQASNGKIGHAPPALMPGGAPLRGTLYTNADINAALRGAGTVNSRDTGGHGTAVAGTAAGNGRAAAGNATLGDTSGVAPEADLLIVKAADCGKFTNTFLYGVVWLTDTARELRQPLVINLSLGGHFSAHDGTEGEEQIINQLTGAGNPGVAVTVAAGNERRFAFAAGGRFGARRPGQMDNEGDVLEVAVSRERGAGLTLLNGYFRHRDEWGIGIRGSGNFLVDEQGQPLIFYVQKINNQLMFGLSKNVAVPAYIKDFVAAIKQNTTLADTPDGLDRISIPLPPGTFQFRAFGASAQVSSGEYAFYLPFYWQGSFTLGADSQHKVATPGNAANVITVGGYNFRDSWINTSGEQTRYNLHLYNIASYSSPGGAGADAKNYKPDIAAPASYTISPLSKMLTQNDPSCAEQNIRAGLGESAVLPGEKYIAWQGTSAATPFAAGVVALMLQKNPTLDSPRIKELLRRTAVRDGTFTGAVPNPDWGYGGINPPAALRATPPAKLPARTPRRRR